MYVFRNGKIIIEYQRGENNPDNKFEEASPPPLPPDPRVEHWQINWLRGYGVLYTPIIGLTNQKQVGILCLKVDSDYANQRLGRYLQVVVVVFATAIVLVTLVTWFLQKAITRPVVRLTKAANQISTSQEIIPTEMVDRKDELGQLANSFSQMLGRLREQQEALTTAKDLAEASAKAKQEFMANMSHEIRTPMTAVLGMTDLLLEKDPSAEQTRLLQAMKSSADQLMALLNDILDFTKIESGKLTFEQRVINLNLVLQNMLVSNQVRAERKGLQVLLDVAPEVPNYFLGDPLRLSQILLNLFSNAVKFTDAGHVTTRVRLLATDETTVRIQFAIEDSGIGIDADKLGPIFSSFTQASSETTRKYGGTGLGLSISKQLVEAQGGQISVESRRGVGSTFSFWLPFTRISEHSAEAHRTETPRQLTNPLVFAQPEQALTQRKGRILLVEDNDFNIMLVVGLLVKWGYEVETATNGRLGVNALRENPSRYDVVLMDVQMPEMDGYQATKAIRDELNNPVPIIAMTASALQGDVQKCLAMGMNDFVSKPFDKKVLAEKLARYVPQVRTT
ncbi:MAG: ATP-binding protein [Bernardetiaceae bacterium]|nr:ATP-binding protein [Bernardetiaceae bacterium]